MKKKTIEHSQNKHFFFCFNDDEAEVNNYISNAENKYLLDSWFPRSVPSFNQILFPNWFTLKALNFDKGRKVI